MAELTTVADDEAVVHDGARGPHLRRPRARHRPRARRRHVPHPAAPRRAAGHGRHRERRALRRDGVRVHRRVRRARFRVEPGETPYPEVMNRGASRRWPASSPTPWSSRATSPRRHDEEYDAFLAAYGPPSATGCTTSAATTTPTTARPSRRGPPAHRLPPASPSPCSTRRPRPHHRQVTDEQLEWLDDLAADGRPPRPRVRPPPPVEPRRAAPRPDDYFGISPDDSERLVDVVARHPGSSATSPATPTATGSAASPPPATCPGSRWPASRTSRAPGPSTASSRAGSSRSTGASPHPRRSPGPSTPGTCSPASTRGTPSAASTTAASPCASA